MPDLITHYLFAKEAMIKMNKQDQIQPYRALYDLGCNGPDFFFYYHILPWQSKTNKEAIHHLGSLLHQRKINDFFECLFNAVKQDPSSINYIYTIGYFAHYFLDRKAHPYIFYFSGVVDESNPSTFIYKYWHKRFEVAIDENMLIEKEKTTIKQFHPARIIRAKEIPLDSLYSFLQPLYQKTFNYQIGKEDFNDSIIQFEQDLKLLYSKKKWKKKIMLKVEKIFNIDPLVSTAMYSIEKENIDFLNLEKKIWYDPCTKEIRNESFLELYDQALDEYIEFVEKFDAYLQDQIEIDELLKQINGLSFETGHQEEFKLKYSRCVYENGK